MCTRRVPHLDGRLVTVAWDVNDWDDLIWQHPVVLHSELFTELCLFLQILHNGFVSLELMDDGPQQV